MTGVHRDVQQVHHTAGQEGGAADWRDWHWSQAACQGETSDPSPSLSVSTPHPHPPPLFSTLPLTCIKNIYKICAFLNSS